VLVNEGALPALDSLGFIVPDWEVTFRMSYYAGARKQCDWQALASRNLVTGIHGASFGETTHEVIGVRWRSLGGIARVDQIDPPIWTATDSVTLTCSVVH
jgi:hypothetical protein